MRGTALAALLASLLGVAAAQTSGGGIGTQQPAQQSNTQAAPSQPCNCPCAQNQAPAPQQSSAQQGTTRVYDSGTMPTNTTGATSSSGTMNQSNTYPEANAAPQQTQQYPQAKSQYPQNQQQTTNPQPAQPQQTMASPGQAQQPEQPQQPQQQPQQDGAVFGTRQPAPTNIPMARTVQVGTEMHATLDTPLSSKTAQPGQPFTATLTDPLTNQSGTVLIPAGAKLRGEVADAESGKILPSMRGRGRLNLRFHDVALPNGTVLPMTATLLGVVDTKGKQSGKTSEEGEVTGNTSGGQAAKNVGIGAGLGTVAGLIFGSALKGLAIGAIAGGGYVLANGGKDVELPADTGLRLRLDQLLTVPQTGTTR